MTRITVDAALSTRLHGIDQMVELCDASGAVLGRFLPQIDLSRYEPLEPQISEEELSRRARSDERTYTTAEVLRHLEQL